MNEIERKFLVENSAFKAQAYKHERIAQGYLNSHPERTVRIRTKGDKCYLTIKGKSNESGTTRLEWETEIPVAEAQSLLELCESGSIDKIRYEVKSGGHIFEVDEFFGENEGLIIAEVELQHEDETFQKPEWLGKEVTGDNRYYNAYLSRNPYKKWK
ncbi:CYTH domain-containing protein [Flavobacterium coralii]|uniref:CYTH domain-containing protein n=1 Tax=Flavobacterium coralii TaxID=2838017 RepID=UPI000C5955C4|nr:adenylate cyclase [Flavobacterium sp.]|tara:strand:- start:69676 stop:70146 length:471 start_codon:yes stop_codon:yes gene_type:complete